MSSPSLFFFGATNVIVFIFKNPLYYVFLLGGIPPLLYLYYTKL
ncbi:gp11 [Brochothrix phage A9]|uniref:Gp11 n=1 Tax=Brochothrix phage A9 TaxID=857312 RepID=D9J0F8_9CAUD|nr:gp11 [Brochothrix phage A9]ADJ53053.1 gp11 [Brochothrix phage A9]